MEKIFNLRFLVPPVLTISIVAIFAMLVNPIEIFAFINIIGSFSFFGIFSVVVLSLGWTISSITTLIINLWRGRVTNFDNKELEIIRKKFAYLTKDSEGKFDKKENPNLFEFIEWQYEGACGDDKDRDEFVRNQIQKRWEMAMAGFNCAVAVAVAWVFLLFYPIIYRLIICFVINPVRIKESFPCVFCSNIMAAIVFIITLVLALIFFYNGRDSYKSVHEMTRLLVRRSEKEGTTNQENTKE